MSLEFEWDRRKAEANAVSHGIDFEGVYPEQRITLTDASRSISRNKQYGTRGARSIGSTTAGLEFAMLNGQELP